ncbi:MAG TPA: ABC transporter ATP-binding protein [Aliiroseovarius sp.]|nr:ABC transporter ATP-binding protein [Aliiroseovarius sp.]
MSLSGLIDPYAPADGPPPRRLAPFFRWALKGSMSVIVIASLLTGAAGMVEAFAAKVLGYTIDMVLATPPGGFAARAPWLFALLAGFFIVLRPVLLGLGGLFNQYVLGPNLSAAVLSRISRWTLGHSVEFFDNDFAGRIAQKQLQVSGSLTEVTVEVVNTVVFAFITVVTSLILVGSIHYSITLAMVGWLGVYFLLLRWFLPRARVRAGARANARTLVTGQLVDTVTNIKTVKLFAHDTHEDAAAHEAIEFARVKAQSWGALSAGFRFALMALAGVLPTMLIGGTAWLWSLGAASEGDIVAAGAISIRLSQMTGWVSFTLMQIYSHVGEVEDGINTLTPPHGLTNADGAPVLVVPKGQVDFRDVSFRYGREAGGVSNVNLTIAPGEKLGIVGASGAGKSTLVAALLRLYDIEDGVIEIDGQDIATVTQESLRGAISVVTQETAMFNRSARDNIAYGRPGADEADIIEAARRAEAHDFILDLEDHMGRRGYEAFLGERGVKLSGGQRQRIALARAILKDAPILVLDEATSALDSEVEAAIQTALERVMEGKTVLAIAHRLSTIAQMDRIVVMAAGRICEAGNHAELLAAKGIYAGLWARQSGGFLADA